MKVINRQFKISIFVGLILFLLYPMIVFDSINKYNPVNFLLYAFSLIIILYSIGSIRYQNINTYNIFLLFYFSALFLNALNISTKQFLKDEEDLYFLLVGPIVVFSFLYVFENIKIIAVKFKSLNVINVDLFYIVVLFLYIFLKLYIGMQVGFRITNFDDISVIESGTKYTLPGISGVSAIMQWLLIIFIPYVKKRYSIIGVISIIVLSGILNVKRGDIIRLAIFIFLYYTFIKIQLKQFNSKKIVQIIAGIFFILIVFTQFGENRMEARGGEAGIIVSYLGSRVDSAFISWIYSYFAFNFEILKFYQTMTPSYEMIHLYDILGENLARESLGLETSISGFNASTFLSPFILDYGYFYFLEIMLFSLIAGFFVYISRKLNFLGLYIFIMMLMSLMVFGDYLFNRSIFMSMMAAICIYPFLNISAVHAITSSKKNR